MKTIFIDQLLYDHDMTKLRQQKRQRNWVAKNNFNRPVRHRDQTEYRRHNKHNQKDQYQFD
jgi:hypothetical protein